MGLSKSELLNGTNYIVDFKPTGLNDVVYLRPLSIGEINTFEEMKSKALGTYVANETASHSNAKRVKGKVEAQAKLNIEKTTIAENKVHVLAVQASLDNDKSDISLTEEEVKQMNPVIFNEILQKVKEISHWDDEVELVEDVENFHQNE